MARLPHKVTRAIAYATSSSSASTTPSTAATADAPQIENQGREPKDLNSLSDAELFNLGYMPDEIEAIRTGRFTGP